MNNDNNVRPNFSASNNTTTGVIDASGQVTRRGPPSEALKTARNNRPEIGVIWSKQSSTTGKEFLSIKLKMPKSKIQELLAAANNDEEVAVDLIAFPNQYKEDNDRRPNFRIFEELSR